MFAKSMSAFGGCYMNETQYGGYYPGVAGKITEVHAVYYHENWGFEISFETQVGSELSDFLVDFDETRDGLWSAKRNNMFAGAVAIDGRTAQSEGARLRAWALEKNSSPGPLNSVNKKIIPKSFYGLLRDWTRRVTSMKPTISN
jgi:hypothetical protein